MDVASSLSRILCSKLLAARRAIQHWNKELFGNIFQTVKKAKTEVLASEEKLEHDMSQEEHANLQKSQAQLRNALLLEEQFRREVASAWG